MTFAGRVASVTGLPPERIEPLASGSLSKVLLLRWSDGRLSVAKSGPATAVEADMLRALSAAGAPIPRVEAEQNGVLILEYVESDGRLDDRAWADIGERLRSIHDRTGAAFGWDADYAFGKVQLDNRKTDCWPAFWADPRLIPTAKLIGGDWSRRVEALASRLVDLLPVEPQPSLLHGDLWTGNIFVKDRKLAALIDPACYYGHCEVDLAMLDLFGSPPTAFGEAYGSLESGWRERRSIYQLFPALVHLCLFGSGYSGMVDRLLTRVGL